MQLPQQFIKDFSAGQITNVNENITPKNSVSLGLNVVFHEELGSAVSRLGCGVINAQVVDGKTCLGLHNFRDSVGTGHKLFVAFNIANNATTSVYDAETGSAVTGATGLTASTKIRFLTFLDECLMINGADAERSWNGSSVITTGGAFDLANVPGSNKLKYCIEWQDRVYLAGNTAAGTSDTVYYSSTPTTGAISWTSGNGSINIEPEDGGGTITGFGKVPGYILIFKERSLKRWDYDSAYPESLINIGTPSQESVVSMAGLCFFYSNSSQQLKGFYYTNGGRPKSISHGRAHQIKKWVDAIAQGSDDDVAGFALGDSEVGWSVGDLTVDGVSYTNVVLRYNIKFDQWSVHSYPSEFRFFSNFVTSGNNVLVGGDDNGYVLQIDKPSIYTDYQESNTTTPIVWEVRSHPEDFEYNQLKELRDKVIVNSLHAQGATVSLILDRNIKTIQPIGILTGDVTELKLPKIYRFHTIEISIKGNQTGLRATIKEIEFPNIIVTENF